jgi:hypothetical protein
MAGSTLSGEFGAECVVSGTAGGGLPSLDSYLVAQAALSTEVHAGPTPEAWDGLPSTAFDVTNRMEGKDGVTVRSDLHVATDGETRLRFDALSKKVEGSGNAGYIRRIDIGLEVRPESAGTWRFQLVNGIDVKKPWFAPTGMFKSEVDKSVRAQFATSRDDLMPKLADQL